MAIESRGLLSIRMPGKLRLDFNQKVFDENNLLISSRDTSPFNVQEKKSKVTRDITVTYRINSICRVFMLKIISWTPNKTYKIMKSFTQLIRYLNYVTVFAL